MALWREFLRNRRQPNASEGDGDLPVMSFGDHLDELRRRLIFALLGSSIGVALGLYYADNIINFLYQPYLLALRWGEYPPHLNYFKPAGSLILYLMTGVKAGLVLASPWIIYQFWKFIAAGLYRRERVVVYRYMAPSMLLFIMGAAFFFFLVLPFMLKFFMQFNHEVRIPSLAPNAWERVIYGGKLASNSTARLPAGDAAKLPRIPIVKRDPTHFPAHKAVLWFNAVDNQLRLHVGSHTLEINTQPANALFAPIPMLHDYLSFVLIMCLVFGLSFEVPMVMMILTQIGVVSAPQFRGFWRFAVLALAILSIILAPTPDVVTFLSIFVPLLALYLLGLALCGLVERKKRQRDDQHDQENQPWRHGALGDQLSEPTHSEEPPDHSDQSDHGDQSQPPAEPGASDNSGDPN